LAKIAVELERALARRRAHGDAGRATPRTIAAGDGWSVADVICTSGPHDRSFEERHTTYSIAMVLSGSFQYRSALGRGLMAPGSLMLGNPSLPYECGHEHGEGDRCVVFWYAPEYFERLTGGEGKFRIARLPPLLAMTPLVTSAAAGALGVAGISWEELGVNLAVRTAALAADHGSEQSSLPLNAEARVTRAVRAVERRPDANLSLAALAEESGLSPYHFLRTFERLTGITPHQYVLRARLRAAATRLATEAGRVIDVALDSGFGDISNFNRAFRTEFGASPRAYRQRYAARAASYGSVPPKAR